MSDASPVYAAPFPSDWSTLLVLMPHPDDPEYMAAAVAKWTSSGKQVRYVLASRGEAGIEAMPARQTAVIREAEQRAASGIVGVDHVAFWDETDGEIHSTAELRREITETLRTDEPDIVVTVFGEAEWTPGTPNQRDHIEFAAAVHQSILDLGEAAPRLFAASMRASHVEAVDDFIETAVRSLAAHDTYLHSLDPATPPAEQARRQLERALPLYDGDGEPRRVAFFQHIR